MSPRRRPFSLPWVCALLLALLWPAGAFAGTAAFVRLDTSTQGNWKGAYGSEGYNVINDVQSDPVYATVTPVGQLLYTWAASTSEPRAMQKAASLTDRIAATWYSGGSYSFAVAITDGQTHAIALYALDWDSQSRTQTIDVRDTATNVLLDSRSMASFDTGVWAVWNVSGNVTVTVTRTGGANAVISGIFFDPPRVAQTPAVSGTADYIGIDTLTQGNWKGVYGAEGYRIIGDSQAWPTYANVLSSAQTSTWVASSLNVRALQKADPAATDRIAATWYSSSTTMSMTVDIRDGATHSIALYLLDWDGLGRTQTIDIRDALTNTLLESRTVSSFGNGTWLIWNLSGSVSITVTRPTSQTASPVVAGAFFGVALPLPPPLLAAYRFEQPVWTGSSGELIDSSGNGRHGIGIGTTLPAPLYVNPALAGNPGSCGYARFAGPVSGGAAFDVTGLPISIVPGKKTSVAFWMYWNGTDNVMPLGWARQDLIFLSNGFGFNTFNGDVFGIGSNGLSNGWHHVVAIFVNGSVTSNELWIDGSSRVMKQRTGTPLVANALVATSMRIGGSTGDINYRFDGLLDELQVHTGALSAATIQSIMAATHPCSAPNPVGGINAYESGTAANQITGVIHTKVAGSGFAVDVVVLNASRTAIHTTFVGDVKVELLNAIDNTGGLDAEGCRRTWTTISGNVPATLTFDGSESGRKTITVAQTPEAWRELRVRMSSPATGTPTQVACSTDNFANRPAAFAAFSASDATWTTVGVARALTNTAVSGGNVHRAGQPFSLLATSVNALGATTVNYVGTAIPAVSACSGAACFATLGAVVTTASAVAGVINRSATYSEVGSMRLKLNDSTFASVDANDGSTAAELTISSPLLTVGRFVPDHFDFTLLTAPVLRTFDSTCSSRSFTYLGQQFGYVTAGQATVLARNLAGATTVNYSGALWKLATGAIVQVPSISPLTPTLDTSAITQPTLTSNSNGTGLGVSTLSDRMRINRPVAVIAPFNANITLTWSVQDASEAAVAGNGTIATTTAFNFSNMAFNSGAAMRFGVLRLIPSYGSQLVDLPVQVEAQYWDGVRMATNSSDQCTALPAAVTTMSNYLGNLSACKTAIIAAPATLVNGRTFLRLEKPGAGNGGSVDLALQLGAAASGATCTAVGGATSATVTASLPWLLGMWNGAIAYDQNPTTRATFGLYRSPFVYRRENF